jgi:hypothetical protein
VSQPGAMRRCCLLPGALLSVSAALLAAVAFPVAASADDGNITIASVSPTGGNPALLTVDVNDANSAYITSLTVHLYNASNADVYDVPVTDWTYPASGPTSVQAVTMQNPMIEGTAPGDLAPGTYTMTVDATDSSADTDNGLVPASGATLAFVYTAPAVTASATAISYGDQTATISGNLTGVAPGGTAPTGIPGEPVSLDDLTASTSASLGTTAADGSYSGTATLNPSDSYQVVVNADSAMASDPAPVSLPVSVSQDATAVSMTTSPPADLDYQGTMTFSGTASYNDGGKLVPLPARSTVQVTVGTDAVPVLTTGSTGSFTYTISNFSPGTDSVPWSVQVPATPLLDQSATVTGTVHVAAPMKVSSFAATLTPFGYIDTSGCVQVGVSGYGLPGSGFELQYARTAGGPWTNLAPLAFTAKDVPASCTGSDDQYFSSSNTILARLSGAYYRAEYKGTSSFEQTVSAAAHAWKYETRIISLTVTPRSVAPGGKLTVSGRLQQHLRSWADYARQQVLIILKPKGSRIWYYIAKVRTTSSGYFTKTFTDPVSADWSAEFLGNSDHLASGGAIYYVPLRTAQRIFGLPAWTPDMAIPLHQVDRGFRGPGQPPGALRPRRRGGSGGSDQPDRPTRA